MQKRNRETTSPQTEDKMPRPRSYYERNQFNAARSSARKRGKKLFLFTRPLRDGKTTTGYYVSDTTPARWKNAKFEQKKV